MAMLSLTELIEQSKEQKFQDDLSGLVAVLFGSNGTGKTQQATKMCDGKVYLMSTENGGSAVKCPKERILSWSQFSKRVAELTSDKLYDTLKKDIKVIVIDTLDMLVDLAEKSVTKEYGVRTLDEMNTMKGVPNGYTLSRNRFKDQINLLTSRGYFVLLISHEETVDEVDPLTGENIKFIQPYKTSNEKSSNRMVRDIADWVIYLKPNGVDGDYRQINSSAICVRTKHTFSRSRFDIDPVIPDFNAKALEKAMLESVRRSAEKEGVGLKQYEEVKEGFTKNDYIEIIKPLFVALSEEYGTNVADIVEYELGIGVKISETTESDCVALDNIYNKLVELSIIKGVQI